MTERDIPRAVAVQYLVRRLAALDTGLPDIDYGRLEELCHLTLAALHHGVPAPTEPVLAVNNEPKVKYRSVTVLGDCGKVHQSVDEWVKCGVCEAIRAGRMPRCR